MDCRVLVMAISSAALAFTLPADTYTSASYVQNGLIAQWDGIDSLPLLENACRKIRQSAISVMENPEQEIIAFAVPVFRPGGKIMALGLTMPLMRCPQKVREKIIAELRLHAGNLGTTVEFND